MLLGRLVVEFEIRTVFHLASILSTKAEYNPETAHRVNVEGTLTSFDSLSNSPNGRANQ